MSSSRPSGDEIAVVDEASLAVAVAELARSDPELAGIVERYGPPPLWDRAPGFPTLVHIILEQQVSLASAQAAFDRLRAAADPLTPARFLELTDAELLGDRVQPPEGALRPCPRDGDRGRDPGPRRADDARRRDGPSRARHDPRDRTVDRHDLPADGPRSAGCLAGRRYRPRPGGRRGQGLRTRPGPDEMAALGEAWRPWRSVAARLFWHDYLSRRGRS